MNRILLILCCFMLPVLCKAQDKDKEPIYEFPAEMPEHIRKMNVPLVEKGMALYQITCAQCHNKKVKGKDVIPDFTIEQLELYQIRIANATHETELTDQMLSAEELSQITTFFTYKKKNNIAATKGKKK